MSNHAPVPSSYSFIHKGKVSLLLKAKYQPQLLRMGIEDFGPFLKEYGQLAPNLRGRTSHFSVRLQDGQKIVIRRYSHGGGFRFLTRDLYLLGSRSFEEIRLTEEIRSAEISTVEPVGAARVRAFFFFYRAYFLSLEVPDADDGARFLLRIGASASREALLKKRNAIRSAGLLLQRFHQSGFFHRDLQLRNILIAGSQLYLIDFDRSYRKQALSSEERMNNLLRLNRSVEKWRSSGLRLTRSDRWRFFQTYSGRDSRQREAFRKKVHAYRLLLSFHQYLWKIQRRIKAFTH